MADFGCEQLHVLDVYLGNKAAHALLIVITAVAYAALHIKLVALVYILLHQLGHVAKGHDVVPVGVFGHLCAVLKEYNRSVVASGN